MCSCNNIPDASSANEQVQWVVVRSSTAQCQTMQKFCSRIMECRLEHHIVAPNPSTVQTTIVQYRVHTVRCSIAMWSFFWDYPRFHNNVNEADHLDIVLVIHGNLEPSSPFKPFPNQNYNGACNSKQHRHASICGCTQARALNQ